MPPPSPSALNICFPKRGNANPNKDRKTEAAALALAAYLNASTRYNWIGKKLAIIPNPKIPEPTIGCGGKEKISETLRRLDGGLTMIQ